MGANTQMSKIQGAINVIDPKEDVEVVDVGGPSGPVGLDLNKSLKLIHTKLHQEYL